jgi:hypothetical protein
MHTDDAQLSRAIESLDATMHARAFSSAGEQVRVLELGLESYLEASLRNPHVFCEVSTELLWRHFGQLKAAVEAHDVDGASRAASDLKAALHAHHLGHPAGRLATP